MNSCNKCETPLAEDTTICPSCGAFNFPTQQNQKIEAKWAIKLLFVVPSLLLFFMMFDRAWNLPDGLSGYLWRTAAVIGVFAVIIISVRVEAWWKTAVVFLISFILVAWFIIENLTFS